MASGLIYLIIIAMWGAYFVPRWLSAHDTSSGREGARFKSAMKIVASTPNIPDPIDPDKKLKALRKRQAIALVLLAATLITAAGSALSLLPVAALLIPATGLTISLIHSRRQVVASQLKKRRLKALQQITTAEIKLDPSALISLSPSAPLINSENKSHWIPLAERDESSSITIIPRDELLASLKFETWSPIEIPKPTYVTAPKAITPRRIIDLTIPGAWSAEQERIEILGESTIATPARDQIFDQELAEQAATEKIKYRNRVVNE